MAGDTDLALLKVESNWLTLFENVRSSFSPCLASRTLVIRPLVDRVELNLGPVALLRPPDAATT